MKIVLKGTPPSLNRFAGRANTWAYRQAKEEWTGKVLAACLKASTGAHRPCAQHLVRIDYYFPSRARHDPDNYAGKFLLDGLTKAGVIMDDDFSHIMLSLHGHVDHENPRTEIYVQEVTLIDLQEA